MHNLSEYILEKFRIGRDTEIKDDTFSVEELRKDYSTVGGAYTKAEKDEFKLKYGVDSNKIRDIQLVILDHLRALRHQKKKFDKNDFVDFIRFDLTSDKYEKWKEYLEQEPDEFVEFLLDYYKCEKIARINTALPPSRLSYADRSVLRVFNNLKKYLGHE